MEHIKVPAVANTLSVKAFGALHHSHYRIYFFSGIVAMIADNIEHVVVYWIIFQKFHSPTLAGFAVISHWLPSLLFSVHSGALADRMDCRKLIKWSQIVYMVSSFAWWILLLTGSLQIWQAVILLLLHGVASVLFGPAQQLIIHDMVGSEYLQSAIRLNASSRSLSTLLGPAIGGALMLMLGPAMGIIANVLNYIPLIIAAGYLPYTGHRLESNQGEKRKRSTSFKELGEIFKEAAQDRRILFMIIIGGVTSLFVGNAFQAQMPEYAHRLGADEVGVQYSALLAANAAGALVAVFLLETTSYLKPTVRSALICTTIWSLAIGLFPLVPSYAWAMILLLLAGFFNITFVSMAQTLVQVLAPAHMRGRFVGLFQMANMGLRVGSGFTVGVLGGIVGVSWSLGISAAVVLAISLVMLALHIMGSHQR